MHPIHLIQGDLHNDTPPHNTHVAQLGMSTYAYDAGCCLLCQISNGYSAFVSIARIQGVEVGSVN